MGVCKPRAAQDDAPLICSPVRYLFSSSDRRTRLSLCISQDARVDFMPIYPLVFEGLTASVPVVYMWCSCGAVNGSCPLPAFIISCCAVISIFIVFAISHVMNDCVFHISHSVRLSGIECFGLRHLPAEILGGGIQRIVRSKLEKGKNNVGSHATVGRVVC